MVFSRQIEGLGQKGDILLAISTSGNSKNIKEAIKPQRKKKKIITIGLTGKSKSIVSKESDYCISVPSKRNKPHTRNAHNSLAFIMYINRKKYIDGYFCL